MDFWEPNLQTDQCGGRHYSPTQKHSCGFLLYKLSPIPPKNQLHTWNQINIKIATITTKPHNLKNFKRICSNLKINLPIWSFLPFFQQFPCSFSTCSRSICSIWAWSHGYGWRNPAPPKGWLKHIESWFRFAPITIVISTINHSYWSYKPT